MAIYMDFYRRGELAERVEAAKDLIQSCRVCPHHCGVNRSGGETGKCNTADLATVATDI